MAVYLQPCDWREYDKDFKYVVDVYGRTNEGDVARLRMTGFRPFFYLRAKEGETASSVQTAIAINFGKPINGIRITAEQKLDAMRGFQGLQTTRVWKISTPSLWLHKALAKELRSGKKLGNRFVQREDLYESNLPPYLKLFHELDLSPASPIRFEGEIGNPEEDRVEVAYEVHYSQVKPYASLNIPLYVAAYDIETYSSTGLFPVATNAGDEIMQIGVSFRWSDQMLDTVARYVLVSGTVEASKDPSVTFIPCSGEQGLLLKFQQLLHSENPDVLCGYNTFGFDDSYIAERAHFHKIELQLGRSDTKQWGKQEFVKTERKTFELASGKYAVRYFDLPGRLPIDLLLSVRREQNLDSYKLDNVANTFLRDKVTKIVTNTGQTEIYTKSTRGLFAGNLVRFDFIGHTVNPYAEGEKFHVVSVSPKSFIIQNNASEFEGVDTTSLYWSFAKDDITAKQMFSSHRGTAAERAVVAKYCIQDCDLVLTLMAKLDTLVNARGMADVCRVPIDFIFLRGQGIKIYSAVAYNASKRNQIIMEQESAEGDTSYEGAIVLPPKIGLYLDQPIPVLDFNSLYPSNMIAFNLSPDTLVYTKTYDREGNKLKHEGIDGEALTELKKKFKIDEVSFDTKNDDGVATGRITCGYAQPNEDPNSVGILPLTLDILLKKRKETRKLMETTEDDGQQAVLNGLQLAYKVVANSVYGQTGSRTSPIRKMEVAACTTALGRARLHEAKTVVESEYGATVIYGDSVASYTPVLIRKNNEVHIVEIEKLGTDWKPCADSNKEYCEIQGVDSWTEKGWTPIQRVIRHALAPHKQMIRVLTHTGLVDVTDDHSLLHPDGTEVSPRDLKLGDSLLHHPYPNRTVNYEGSNEKARIAGFFFGDGSCGSYDCPSGKKSSWALNNANPELLKAYKELCEYVYPEFEWVVDPTLVSSNVFKLSPKSQEYGSLVKFVNEYRADMYVDQRKNIPLWIMNGSPEVRQGFWDGLYDADGDKDLNGYIRIDQKHPTTVAQIAWLGHTLGYSVSMNTRSDKPMITRLTFTKNTQRKNPTEIKKMHPIEYSGYVYDLTTENHHFQAGVGTMIVHNTDSIFVQFPTKGLEESMEMGRKAAEKITSLCRKPYKIEYEKTFYPFILFCRKRYVGMMYEDDPHHCKRKSMGIALKRRDNAPIVKDVFGGALDILMEDRDLKKAQRFVQTILTDVIQNKMPLEKYVITKQLRDDYKNPDQIAHRVLADRMAERDEGNAPQVGDRLAFIYVEKLKDAKKQGDRIEHYDFVKEKKLKPDVEFYITNQIQNPVSQLFALGIEQLEGYRPTRRYSGVFEEFMEKYNDEEEATLATLKLKEKELDKILFLGAPYLQKLKRGPLDSYFRK